MDMVRLPFWSKVWVDRSKITKILWTKGYRFASWYEEKYRPAHLKYKWFGPVVPARRFGAWLDATVEIHIVGEGRPYRIDCASNMLAKALCEFMTSWRDGKLDMEVLRHGKTVTEYWHDVVKKELKETL